jgi:hypothetical protein
MSIVFMIRYLRVRVLERSGSSTILEYASHACLEAPWRTGPEVRFSGEAVARGPWLEYRYPEARPADEQARQITFFDNRGARWSLRASDPECAEATSCVWVGLDKSLRTYEVIGVQAN